MRKIKDLINDEKRVYILLKTKAIQYRFMSDAHREGISFGDGESPLDRMVEDVMALRSDGTICFLGFAGRLYMHHANDLILVDYEKYIDRRDDYIIG
jgi:hypothetical protein